MLNTIGIYVVFRQNIVSNMQFYGHISGHQWHFKRPYIAKKLHLLIDDLH